MPHSLLALGANLGDRAATLQAASDLLAVTEGVRLLRTSRWHEMAPVGGPGGQRPFLNAAALIETTLSATQLFAKLVNIEQRLGRKRETHWGPRSIDIDLLIHGQQIIEQSDLVVPHARMVFRRFVLEPAVEIAPQMRHPTTGWTVRRLWENVQRDLDYITILGPARAERTSLGRQVARVSFAGQTAPASQTSHAEEGTCCSQPISESDPGSEGSLRKVPSGQLPDTQPVVPFFASDQGVQKPGYDSPWDLASELALVAHRSKLLEDAIIPQQSAPQRSVLQQSARSGQGSDLRWLISDFWIDTSVVFSRLFGASPRAGEEGEESVQERIQAHLQSLREVLPVPKLIVWFDPPEGASVRSAASGTVRSSTQSTPAGRGPKQAEQRANSSCNDSSYDEQHYNALREEVFAARVAPFFRLDSTTAVQTTAMQKTPSRWDTELLAALQAMR